MGTPLELAATDGHRFAAYRADPPGKPRGGLVVVQEIFGVNSHIRSVADGFAADGYVAIAPALFDRVERGLDIGYSQPEIERGRALMQKMSMDDALKDVAAAMKAIASSGKIGIVGYCWGGTVAWVSAAKLDGLACSSPYYGGGILANKDLKPRCPVLFHFGETDHAIPIDQVQALKIGAARARVPHLPGRARLQLRPARLVSRRKREASRASARSRSSGSYIG